MILAASVMAGLLALREDIRVAYLWAGPSVFRDVERQEMTAVREAIPEGAVLLLFARPTDHWHARLWQRGLYPRNPVVVLIEPFPEETYRKFRELYGVRYAVLLGPPSFDPGLLWRRDLGPIPGLPGQVSFGEPAR